MKNKASDYYKQGYSCSESVVKAAIDAGLCDESLLSTATVFSGGMSSGCICGAVAGAQLVLGHNFGKGNAKNNPEIARQKAKEFMDEIECPECHNLIELDWNEEECGGCCSGCDGCEEGHDNEHDEDNNDEDM